MKCHAREYDQHTGQLEEHYYDEDTGKYHVKRSWDMDSIILERNQRMRNDSRGFSYINQSDMAFPVASLDNNTVVNLLRDHDIDVFNMQSDPDTQKRFLRWLEQNPVWKTTDKKVYRAT